MRQQTINLLTTSLLFAACHSAYAAKPIDLNTQDPAILNSVLVISRPGMIPAAQSNLVEMQRTSDMNRATHVRLQQTYAGYTVFGADAIVHLPKVIPTNTNIGSLLAKSVAGVTMDGTIYQDIAPDLSATPNYIFSKEQADKAARTIAQKIDSPHSLRSSKLIVYIDEAKKAHWAYQLSYSVQAQTVKSMPALPVYIVDAVTFDVYQQWDEIKTASTLESVKGGGFGGNKKMGQLVFDGLSGHLASFNIKRDAKANTCYLQNSEILVRQFDALHSRDGHDAGYDFTFPCKTMSQQHGQLYWNESDPANGAFSPANDALFQGQVVKNMYRDWYRQDILVDAKGQPKILRMLVHKPMANAYWDPSAEQMVFGDGQEDDVPDLFYPLTSLGVTAHEMSHVFTEMHSNLVYRGHSGGLNESFSDMAAKAAEYYVNGKDLNWQIGPEVFKQDGALRYMDHPSKDCGHRDIKGVSCSIEKVSDYIEGSRATGKKETNVHYSSGIYNRVFYLIATAPGWDTRKAFDVMVEANMHYWTSSVDFHQAGCGVIKALKAYDEKTHGDFNADLAVLKNAYKDVGVDTAQCRV